MAMLLTQILFWKPWRTLPAFRQCCSTIRCAAERSPWLWGGEQITGIKTGGERAGLVGGCQSVWTGVPWPCRTDSIRSSEAEAIEFSEA